MTREQENHLVANRDEGLAAVDDRNGLLPIIRSPHYLRDLAKVLSSHDMAKASRIQAALSSAKSTYIYRLMCELALQGE
jgi:hypothetical protein